MIATRDTQLLREAAAGRVGPAPQLKGFAGHPSLTYRRTLDRQQKISSSIMSHLDFITFQFLDLDESVYTARLHHEVDMWNHKKDLSRSPHKFIRLEATKLTSPFIEEQEDLIKFKKEQRYSKDDREITKKDLTNYLRRL